MFFNNFFIHAAAIKADTGYKKRFSSKPNENNAVSKYVMVLTVK